LSSTAETTRSSPPADASTLYANLTSISCEIALVLSQRTGIVIEAVAVPVPPAEVDKPPAPDPPIVEGAMSLLVSVRSLQYRSMTSPPPSTVFIRPPSKMIVTNLIPILPAANTTPIWVVPFSFAS
jgi:hypothetical protein